jgi:hypothetical protein
LLKNKDENILMVKSKEKKDKSIDQQIEDIKVRQKALKKIINTIDKNSIKTKK